MMNLDGKSDELKLCEKLPAVKSVDGNDKKTDNMNMLKFNNDLDKLKNTNSYDVKLSDDDKCVNNQDICNNLKNVKTINKNDCNVVIDDDTQSKQQQIQQQQQPPEKEQPPPSTLQTQKTYGCVHYKRKAKFVVSQMNENNTQK